MLSQKTQSYLCDLLFEIAKGEKQVEVVRQLLGEQEAFVPYSAFKRLDQQRKKYINSYDIKDFLAENGFPHSLQECDLFIKAYDIDQDTKISYSEFLRAVLPFDNQTLRENVSQRPPLEVKSGERLPCDLEYTLAKLIDREIQCNLQIQDKKAFLETRYDYSAADCFNTIDINGKKTLDGRDFYAFFRKNGLVSYEDEITSLHRRLDYDKDNYISYEDFFLGISKQESLQKAEKRNPHEHQIVASPYRQTLSNKSPITDRKSSLLTQQTPLSNIKDKMVSQQSSQKKNVKIMSPQKNDNYSHLITEVYASPLRENSRMKLSTGFKHSPAKSILKNSSHKMEIEKNILRNELQIQKQIDLLHQSNYSSRNYDLKEDSSYFMRDHIRNLSKENRTDQSWLHRDVNQKDRFLEMEKDRASEREREKLFQKEKERLEKDKLIQQEKEKLLEKERERMIEKEKERIFERERLLEKEKDRQYQEDKNRLEREEKLRNLENEEREMERKRRNRDKEEYDYQIQKMKAAEKEQQLKTIERENQGKQQQKSHENELKQLKIDNELRQKERERRLQQIENEKRLAKKQVEKFEQENQEKQRKQIHLEAEQRLLVIEKEQRQRQLDKIKQQQEKEDRERKLKEEEKFIREQIEYERILKQKLEDEKRNASIEKRRLSDLRSKNYLGENDKYKQLKYPQISSSYTHSKTASIAERSPLEQYSTPKRLEDNQIDRLSQSNNYRDYPAYNKQIPENGVLSKPVDRSLYSRQQYDQTNKFDKPSYTSPIDLRVTSKSRTPPKNSYTASKDRNMEKDDLYSKQSFSTYQKPHLTKSQNRSKYIDNQIEDLLITQFLDIISAEKKSERARQDLALRPDFKLGDLYKVLDKTKKGFISSINLEEVLRKLDILPRMNDIYLLMRKYDLDNDGQLRFSDIAEALTPKQKEYAKLLNKRESILDGEVTIQDVYSFETLKLLKELFITLIQSEQTVESIRNELKLNQEFSFQDTFSLIDKDQDGFITKLELQTFFEKNSVFCSEKELQLLIQRFDQDRDNKINFGEFVQELSPKSNRY